MEPAADVPRLTPRSAPAEPRQRWRIVYQRPAGAAGMVQRAFADQFERGLLDAGLPLAGATRSRPRVVFAAALPLGVAAERELVDVVLAERLPIHEVRDRVATALPGDCRLVDLYDVWLGQPSLAGQASAADYRVTLRPPTPDGPRLDEAGRALLASPTLVRERQKGGRAVPYDLRPLLADVAVASPGPPVRLRIRTRLDPELGAGRPEEVVGALAEIAGSPLEIDELVRERVLLAEDLPRPRPSAGPRPAGQV